MKSTPMQSVKNDHGGRAGLVDKILGLIETDDQDATRSSLMGTTNAKLLRIYETAKVVKETHGGRKNLIDKIVKARYPKGNPDDGVLKLLNEATEKRLLDEYRKAN